MHQKLCATALNRSCSVSALSSQPNLARARPPRSAPWAVDAIAWKVFVEQSLRQLPRPRPQRPSVPRQAKVERLVVELKRAAKPSANPARWRILQALRLGDLEAAQLARMLWLPYEVTHRTLHRLKADGLVSRSETRVPARRRRSGAPAFSWRLCAPVGEAPTSQPERGRMFTRERSFVYNARVES